MHSPSTGSLLPVRGRLAGICAYELVDQSAALAAAVQACVSWPRLTGDRRILEKLHEVPAGGARARVESPPPLIHVAVGQYSHKL